MTARNDLIELILILDTRFKSTDLFFVEINVDINFEIYVDITKLTMGLGGLIPIAEKNALGRLNSV